MLTYNDSCFVPTILEVSFKNSFEFFCRNVYIFLHIFLKIGKPTFHFYKCMYLPSAPGLDGGGSDTLRDVCKPFYAILPFPILNHLTLNNSIQMYKIAFQLILSVYCIQPYKPYKSSGLRKKLDGIQERNHSSGLTT